MDPEVISPCPPHLRGLPSSVHSITGEELISENLITLVVHDNLTDGPIANLVDSTLLHDGDIAHPAQC